MKAEEIQDILNHKDVLKAIACRRVKNQVKIALLQDKMAVAFKIAVAPPSRPTNTVDMAFSVARNVFKIWQGVSLGLRVVRGFRSAFRSR